MWARSHCSQKKQGTGSPGKLALKPNWLLLDAKDIAIRKETRPPPHILDPSQTAAENQAANILVLEEQSEWDKCDALALNLIVKNINDSHLSLFEDPPINSSSHLAYE